MDNNKKDFTARLGFFTTTAIVIGAMIGSGIFKKPAFMAAHLGSPEWIILVWVIAGVLTFFGALTNAEIAGAISATGGQYIFFRRIYGEFTAYMYGWSVFSVMQTGSIASITYVFSEYFQYFYKLPRFAPEIEKAYYLSIPMIGNIYPLENAGVKGLTIFVILFLTTVNYFGVKFGGRIADVFTTIKLLAITALAVMCFSYAGGSFGNWVTPAPIFHDANFNLLAGLVMAVSAAFWAYDGWNNVTFIAGEVKEPQKNIPRSLAIGTLVVVGVYILINLAFMYVMPVSEMAQSQFVAADAAKKSIGGLAGSFIALAVMFSAFGASNGSIMASSRVYFAMARKNMFFAPIAKTHPKFETPANSLILQAAWASALVVSGAFDVLTDMLIFVSWVFYALGAYGVFVLRRKEPDLARPYKVWGYPYVPILFIIFACLFVFYTLYNDITLYVAGKTPMVNSLFGILLTLPGLPLYYYFKKRRTTTNIDQD